MMQHNIPQDVQARAMRMHAAIADGEKICKTVYKKDGELSSVVNAEGCIVPTTALRQKHVAISPAAAVLFRMWEQGDRVLRENLDEDLMNQLKAKLVQSKSEAKKLNKKADKEEKKNLGFKELSKAKPCINCENATKQAYTFNLLTPEGAKIKPMPYCHRKDCREARDEYAQSHGRPSAAPSPMASPVHPSVANDNNAPAAPAAAAASAPAKSLSEMTNDELLEKALALPEGHPAQNRLLELYNSRSVQASEASTDHEDDEDYEADAVSRPTKAAKSRKKRSNK